MRSLQIRRLGYALGAQVSGVDLSRLDDDLVSEIRKAWLEHIVLCFPNQDFDPKSMREFCSKFGTLDDFRNAPENRLPDNPAVKVVSNKPLVENAGRYTGERTGNIWHADQSYTLNPSVGTFLHAKALPSVGGDTMFANTYLAYETLSSALRKILDGLSGVHDQALSGTYWNSMTAEQQAASRLHNPPVVHPVVTIHPETGRKVLNVNPRVRQFVGMTEEESKPLIRFLCEHAVRYEFIYRHRWTLGDVVMWDNRSALHYAVPDYDQREVRRMLRCSQLGPAQGEVYSNGASALAGAAASM